MMIRCNDCKLRTIVLLILTLSLAADVFSQPKEAPAEPEIPQKEKTLFSPDAFLIGRDFHHNKFIDREKGLKGMAECNFTLADAADPQNYSLCKKLGLSVIVSEGPHLTGQDWIKMSDAEIDNYIKKMVEK